MASKQNFDFQEVLDVEKNVYKSILINNKTLETNQEWFSDNLNVSKFRNGDIIIQAQNKEEWRAACENKQPAWSYFEDKKELGKLYNIYATLDSRGLAPEGFEIPNYIDFSIMGLAIQEYEPVDSLVGNIDGGRLNSQGITNGGLKMMAKDFWKKKGKNISGLSIIGGGQRIVGTLDDFIEFEKTCHLWLRPTGKQITLKDLDLKSSLDFPKWYNFEIIKSVFPNKEFNLNCYDEYLVLNQEDYDVLKKERFDIDLNPYNKNNIWNKFYESFYPVKKSTEQTYSNTNLSLAELIAFLDNPSRNGFRKAVFCSGKEQIYFTSTTDLVNGINYEGCYCRPFRYV